MIDDKLQLWKLPAKITVTEQVVGEGLAAEPNFIPTQTKIWLINELIDAGFKSIQVSNFGNPRFMPQFRDCEEIFRKVKKPEDVSFQSPTLNMRALQRVIELKKEGCGPDSVEVLLATTDAFNQFNVGKTTAEQWGLLEELVKAARDAGLKAIGGIGGVWTCLGQGTRVPANVAFDFAERWVGMGIDHLTHAEGTIGGEPAPNAVYEYFSRMLDKYPDPDFHVFHLHDAYCWGVPCFIAAMQAGITRFESCLGGLQGGPGCRIMDNVPVVSSKTVPAPEFSRLPHMGLVPTEDFVSICDAMGVQTGIDVQRTLNLGHWVEKIVGRRLWSTRLRWVPHEL